MFAQMHTQDTIDPYYILRIRQDATQEEIHDSYRRLIKKYHPDKGGDPEIFKEVQWAYKILADPENRRRFDSRFSDTIFDMKKKYQRELNREQETFQPSMVNQKFNDQQHQRFESIRPGKLTEEEELCVIFGQNDLPQYQEREANGKNLNKLQSERGSDRNVKIFNAFRDRYNMDGLEFYRESKEFDNMSRDIPHQPNMSNPKRSRSSKKRQNDQMDRLEQYSMNSQKIGFNLQEFNRAFEEHKSKTTHNELITMPDPSDPRTFSMIEYTDLSNRQHTGRMGELTFSAFDEVHVNDQISNPTKPFSKKKLNQFKLEPDITKVDVMDNRTVQQRLAEHKSQMHDLGNLDRSGYKKEPLYGRVFLNDEQWHQ